jgi:hypothetical protein
MLAVEQEQFKWLVEEYRDFFSTVPVLIMKLDDLAREEFELNNAWSCQLR